MSYILDALKKSEQQRSQGNIPDVQTIHSSSINYKNEKRALWPYILVAAVLLNFIAITYFIYDKSFLPGNSKTEDQTESRMVSIPVNTPEQKSDISPDKAAPANNAVAPTVIVTNKTTRQEQMNTPDEVEANTTSSENIPATKKQNADHTRNKVDSFDNDQVISYYDLEESIRLGLPAIIISAHVYSSNPQQRSIVINNNFMEEGEYFMDDLVLHEITKDGAIFNYHGTLFNYGAVSSWQ